MKKLSLRNRIINYLRKYEEWCNGGELERLTLSAGYKASNGSRRARELAEEGLLERRERNGSVWYRYRKVEVTKSTPIEENGVIRFKQERLLI